MIEEELFHRALEKPTLAEQLAFLDEVCADQPELRQRVERLLRSHRHEDSFLQPEVTTDEPVAERPGTVIGPYKLLEPIGEGGMGAVWMAQQTEPVKRLVALKLIKPGMDSKQVIARFEAERQALALMDHPNIAKVLDGGTTSTGRPYFVMDLVKGMQITKYCDEHRLTPRQRLELFMPVCQAVQHAHQKGVIHRDIKPSNVLVALYDGKPVPKVIDFGVAKAAGQPLTDRTLVTGFGAIVGTLEYMSPEQAEVNQLDIDTRSDVYSLGVLLYELLTGSPPFSRKDLEKAGMLEMLRVIREQEPSKPSTKLSTAKGLPTLAANRGTEPAKLSRLVRGELDWIAMKALEKDRNRRYETANGFAADVQRYLTGEPVLAAPPSKVYRITKFVQRNRVAVFLSLFVVACVLAILINHVIASQGVREERNRALVAAEQERLAKVEANQAKQEALAAAAAATRARDLARKALDDMTSDVTGDSLATQKQLTPQQKAFLARVLDYYRELAGEHGGDEKARHYAAAAAYRVGLIEVRLGHAKEAEEAFRRAQTEFTALAAEFPKEPEHRRGLAFTRYQMGALLGALGKFAEADTAYQSACDLFQSLATEAPDRSDLRLAAAVLRLTQGQRFAAQRETARAEEALVQARTVFKELTAADPKDPKFRRHLATAHEEFGKLYHYHHLDKVAEAEAAYRASLALRKALAAEFPNDAGYQDELAGSHTNLGLLLDGTNRPKEGAGEYIAAVRIREKLVADFPGVLEYRIRLGALYGNVGRSYRMDGRPVDSLEWFDKAIATLTAEVEREPQHVEAQRFLRNTHASRAKALAQLRRFADAVKDWDKAVELSRPKEKPWVRADRVPVLAQAGRVEEAVAEVDELTRSPGWTADRWYDFACVYAIASGKIADKKQEYADRAMTLLQQAVKAGWNAAAHLAKDEDLVPLRGREDFKKLLTELEKKAKPKTLD